MGPDNSELMQIGGFIWKNFMPRANKINLCQLKWSNSDRIKSKH